MNHSLTIQEAYQVMLAFLDSYHEKGECNSEDIAALLSRMSQTIWEEEVRMTQICGAIG